MNLLKNLIGSINLFSSEKEREKSLDNFKTDMAETGMHSLQQVGGLFGFDLVSDMADHYQVANKKSLNISPSKLRE